MRWAPIHDPTGEVVAALSVSGPVYRLTAQLARRIAPDVGFSRKRRQQADGSPRLPGWLVGSPSGGLTFGWRRGRRAGRI